VPAPDVQLRDVTTADLPCFFEHQRDPEATALAAFQPREWDAFSAHWARLLDDAATAKQTILVDGQVAGNLVCFPYAGRWEVGYWLGRDFWGKGVATRALAAFLGQITQRPLHAVVVAHNVASRRVLEKCGFTHADDAFPPIGDGVDALLLVLDA
jgi:RimJ/RimL family protein N-acetyltransferase